MSEILNKGDMKPKSSNAEYSTPFDIVPLPSKGLLYTDGPLVGATSIEVHYLTAIQEDILTSPNLLSSGLMLDALISSVVKDKSIDPSKLTLGDRNAIIIWLRSTGYGSEYPVRLKCNSCGNEWINEFDLGILEVRNLETLPDSNGLFEFDLPQTKTKIKFRMLTSENEIDILKRSEAIQKQQGSSVDHSLSLQMMAAIVEVDGINDPLATKSFVESMPVRDARAFREYVSNIEPGILMTQDATCPKCMNVSQEVIPIRGNFFWPDNGV